jgi:hypothetical protein
MTGSQPNRAAGVAGSTWLMLQGFTPFETIKLLELRQRYERGTMPQTIPEQRLRFARWLIDHRYLDESASDRRGTAPSPTSGPAPIAACARGQGAPATVAAGYRPSASGDTEAQPHARSGRCQLVPSLLTLARLLAGLVGLAALYLVLITLAVA